MKKWTSIHSSIHYVYLLIFAELWGDIAPIGYWERDRLLSKANLWHTFVKNENMSDLNSKV